MLLRVVLYTFTPGSDFGGGAHPLAGLVNVKGVLYGTASVGGNGYGCNDNGCGVVYSVTTTGNETVLHVFNGGSDGAGPDSAVIDVNGTLYGTTPNGRFKLPAFWLRNRLRLDALTHTPPARPHRVNHE